MNRTLPMNGWYGKVKKNQIESILAEKCELNSDFFSAHDFTKNEFWIVIALINHLDEKTITNDKENSFTTG